MCTHTHTRVPGDRAHICTRTSSGSFHRPGHSLTRQRNAAPVARGSTPATRGWRHALGCAAKSLREAAAASPCEQTGGGLQRSALRAQLRGGAGTPDICKGIGVINPHSVAFTLLQRLASVGQSHSFIRRSLPHGERGGAGMRRTPRRPRTSRARSTRRSCSRARPSPKSARACGDTRTQSVA